MSARDTMLHTVENVKKEAEKAGKAYDLAAKMIEIESRTHIDLFSGTAGSQVLKIASDSKKACDDLYASYQSLVGILDEHCRSLLEEFPSEIDAYVVKEVYEMIKWLNDESEISATFSASLNSSSLGDVAGVKYHPLMKSKMIEKYWSAKFAAMPGAKEAEALYVENKRREREIARAARIAEQQRQVEQEKRRLVAERAAAEEEKKRREEKEGSLRVVLDEMRPLFLIADRWISVSNSHAVVVKEDGTVVATGKNDNGQCDVSKWKDVVQVASCEHFTYGLTRNGNVLVAGRKGLHKENKCQSWRGIIQIAAGNGYLLGIDKAGNIHSTAGGPTKNDTVESIVTWRGLNRVEVDSENVVALTGDNVLQTRSYNYYGRSDLSCGGGNGIKNVVDYDAGYTGCVVLGGDGCCNAYGGSGGNACVSAENISAEGGLVKVKMIRNRPVGITYEKKLVVGTDQPFGRNDSCYREWTRVVEKVGKPIVAVAGSVFNLLLLLDDGSVYCHTGRNWASELKEGYLFGENFHAFHDFKIFAESIANGEKHQKECREKAAAWEKEWSANGLCRYCGGSFKKSLFSFKCVKCGKKKDY